MSYYEDDERGLRELRAHADEALTTYLEAASDAVARRALEMVWHGRQRDFYAAVLDFHYAYGEVPAWVAEWGLRPSEDGTP